MKDLFFLEFENLDFIALLTSSKGNNIFTIILISTNHTRWW